MVKVEVREFGRGGSAKRDRVTQIEVDQNEIHLFETEDPPTLREKGGNVLMNFPKRKSIVVDSSGQLVNKGSVEIPPGKSVNIRPFNPGVRVSDIPDAKIKHLQKSKEE